MILPRTSEGLYLLQRVRDEAHRFAITFHRQRRSKAMTASALDAVPGLGQTRRTALLRHFGSLKRIRSATAEEIAEVPGIGAATAQAVVDALAGQTAPASAVNVTTGEILDNEPQTAGAGEECGERRRGVCTRWARREHPPGHRAGRDDRPRGAGRRRGATDVLILTGMSGAGRSTTGNALEDLGWYVVDNLPPQMLAPMADLAERSRGGVTRLAAVVDVRSRSFFVDLREALSSLRERGLGPRLLFLDAADEVLVRRFESVRRPHPLQGDGRILDGIAAERALLEGLKADADIVIDTSGLNVHQLSAKVAQAFEGERGLEPRCARR